MNANLVGIVMTAPASARFYDLERDAKDFVIAKTTRNVLLRTVLVYVHLDIPEMIAMIYVLLGHLVKIVLKNAIVNLKLVNVIFYF